MIPRMYPVGVLGTFDLDNFGDLLFPRILRHELARRLPEVPIRAFAPFGRDRPSRWADEDTEPLGPWTEERAASLGKQLRAVLIGGGDLIHLRPEALGDAYGAEADEYVRQNGHRWFVDGLGAFGNGTPVAWNAPGVPFAFEEPREAARIRDAVGRLAYVSVRDDISRGHLESAGVDREIHVVPDTALLAPRVFPVSEARDTLERLRAKGAFPPGEVVVVQGNHTLLPHAPALADGLRSILAERTEASVALISLGPSMGDELFVEALRLRLPEDRTWVVPVEASLADLAAVLWGCAAYAGSSLHGFLVATSFGRPATLLHLNAFAKHTGLSRLLEDPRVLVDRPSELADALAHADAHRLADRHLPTLQRRIDEHFDRLAEVVAGRQPRPPVALARRVEDELLALRAAHRDRAQALEDERGSHAGTRAQLEEERQRLGDELRGLDETIAGLERELRDLRGLKVLRYTKALRRLYGRFRRALGRDGD